MKLSIITVNYNNADGLRKTIESVLTQTFADYEYIIVDGASCDGSMGVILSEVQKIEGGRVRWISEPDTGIYNAINKGIRMAKGEYCLFLNSGDYLYAAGTLEKAFAEKFTEDIVYGEQLVEKDGHLQMVCFYEPEDISFATFIHSTLPHQCTFIRREMFNKVGLYNENNRIVSDWEFNMKALFLHNCTLRKISVPISVYDTNGISSSEEYRELHDKEKRCVLDTYFPRIICDVDVWERTKKSKTYKLAQWLRKIFRK